jgi:hypothetical protein
MKCEIVNFMVSVNPYSVSAGVGPMRAYCRCFWAIVTTPAGDGTTL